MLFRSLGSALAVSIDVVAGTLHRAQLSLDSATRRLAALLSPRKADNRCVLRVGDGQLLVCALDGASTDILMAEADKARNTRSLNTFSCSLTPVKTPLELQDGVRRMLEASSSTPTLSGVRGRPN